MCQDTLVKKEKKGHRVCPYGAYILVERREGIDNNQNKKNALYSI